MCRHHTNTTTAYVGTWQVVARIIRKSIDVTVQVLGRTTPTDYTGVGQVRIKAQDLRVSKYILIIQKYLLRSLILAQIP